MPRLSLCKGVRVLDFGQAHAGPFGSQLLGDLGAEVIKIEPPHIGDSARQTHPQIEEGMSYYIVALNRNKKSVTLNLLTPSGKKAFYDLVRVSDVVYDNFRKGVLEKLGADYETISKINPRIISCSIYGWGPSGPLSNSGAFNDAVTALSGMNSLCAESDGTIVRPPVALADICGGMNAATAILASLYERTITGKGRKLEVSLLNSCFSVMQTFYEGYFVTGQVPKGEGTKHEGVPFSGLFATKDGYIGLGPCWPRIARVVGREYLIDDPRFATSGLRSKNKIVLEALVEEALREHDSDYWVDVLRAEDIVVGKVNKLDEALQEPQVIANKVVNTIDFHGEQQIKVIDCPIRASAGPYEEHSAPPRLGEHSLEIFKDLLGYSPDEINALQREQKQSMDELAKHVRHNR